MPTTNKAKIPVGFLISGKYRVTGELGRGGMAAVYEAENVDIGKRVAIKVLAQELISSAVVVERFLREARAVAAIRSPHICDVYDSGRLEDGRPFLVLELLEGESLYERMIRVGQIDIQTTVAVVTQTCKGLIKAHAAGIVHRDLKPENIFVSKDEEGRVLAKILDFGLAKFYSSMDAGSAGQARLTREGAVFGTPAYMSPEQVRGQGAVDSRADLWALGAITYESLTGRTVWSTDQGVAMTFAQIANAPLPDPLSLRPDLPESFRIWFQKALDRNIDKRFQTPKEFADELLRAMEMGQLSSASIEGEDDPVTGMRTASHPNSHIGGSPTVDSKRSTASPTDLPSPAGFVGERGSQALRTGSRNHFAAPGSSQRQTGGAGQPLSSKPDLWSSGADRPTAAKEGGLSAGRLVVGVVTLGLVAGAAYGGYRVLMPPTKPPVPTSASVDGGVAPNDSSPTASTSANGPTTVADRLPFLQTTWKAQDAIAQGDLEGGQKLMRDAFAQGGHGMPRTMLEHLEQAIAGKKENAACQLTGLGRPRFADLIDGKPKVLGASRPTIALGPGGPVVAWTENRDGNDQAFAVALDDSLRAKTAPFPVTPEGQAIGLPELYGFGDKLVLTYWDSRGAQAGVFARFIDADGRLASSAHLVGQSSGGAAWPSLVAVPNGYAMSWVAPTERNTDDLFLRRLSDTLEPQGDGIRISALKPSPMARTRVRFPDASSDGDAVNIVFRLERDPERLAERIRIPFADLSKPVDMKGVTNATPDRSAGDLELVNSDKVRADQASIACSKIACYVVWNDDGREGASAAYFEAGKAQPLWRHKFTKRGKRAAVSIASNGSAQVFWFEAGKVVTGSMDRDKVAEPSRIARVTGDEPLPSVAPGKKSGEWYVAWLDSEAGHFEVYVARAQCK